MASEMVMAYGDNGLELTPVEETVSVGCIPAGRNNEWIPASVQWFSTIRSGCVPTRLLKVRFPTKKNGLRYASINFACTPFVRYELDSGPVYGDWSSCCIRSLADATHPIFGGLSQHELARLVRAGKAAEIFAAGVHAIA